MYRVLVFLACLAVGFGKNSSTTTIVQPTTAVTANTTTAFQTATLVTIATSSVMSLHTSMATPMVMSSSSPMVTPSPTHSSTPAPKPSVSTTTTPKPTAKPTSKPPPKPTNGDYSVRDKPNGTYCLLAKLSVSFKVSYMRNTTEKIGNKTTYRPVKEFVSVDMPYEDFSTGGSKCGSNNSTLKVSWPKKDSSYFFMMSFGRTKAQNVTSHSGWEVTAVELTVSTKNNSKFENATEMTLMFESGNETELGYLSGSKNGSYKCGVTKDYPFNGNNGTMKIKFAQLQPFDVHSSKGKEDFGAENNCVKPGPKKNTSNIVPIAVGCALAGLVLIVLIAYIIGRRKSQRGYEKV